MSKTHELKVRTEYYDDVACGRKPFELRLNDRGFEVGDMLMLREWFPKACTYSGKSCLALVTYMLTNFEGMTPGYVIMGIKIKLEPSVEELISRSSLGTPEAVAMRERVPREVVDEVLRRADELEAERHGSQSAGATCLVPRSEFRCPVCDGMTWGTSGDIRMPGARGHCNWPGCRFTWRRDDHDFLVFRLAGVEEQDVVMTAVFPGAGGFVPAKSG
jgi:hypothetical protein